MTQRSITRPARSIHEPFEAQAGQTPDQVALVFERQTLSYGELNRRANQLAHHLRSLGVGPNVLVGLCVKRSFDMMVGLLGILKAGAAYVPMDPGYPKERLQYILEDSKASVVLTQESLVDGLPSFAGQMICLDKDWVKIADESEEESHRPGQFGGLGLRAIHVRVHRQAQRG